MPVSLDQLNYIMPRAHIMAFRFIEPLNAAMTRFDIDTPARIAAFLAQVAHESGELHYVREIASGVEYEGRQDLGNIQPGDGERFAGRGLIQITGRDNYRRCSLALGVDFLSHPELLETPENACLSAAWFWQWRGLNKLADAGNFVTITKRINGGTMGLIARLEYLGRAAHILEVTT